MFVGYTKTAPQNYQVDKQFQRGCFQYLYLEYLKSTHLLIQKEVKMSLVVNISRLVILTCLPLTNQDVNMVCSFAAPSICLLLRYVRVSEIELITVFLEEHLFEDKQGKFSHVPQFFLFCLKTYSFRRTGTILINSIIIELIQINVCVALLWFL